MSHHCVRRRRKKEGVLEVSKSFTLKANIEFKSKSKKRKLKKILK